ncbi:S8 family serine peptidase [Jannaschia sp. R86511]|uniref:S8 family serine peptidase n=1 Tax=Jannaschia sp. R86511 TaxID=3093853 RepID=UPI0036D244F4
MSTVTPWSQACRPRTPAPARARLVGTVVSGLACLTLASLVVGPPAAQAAPRPVPAPDWSATEDPGSAWSIAAEVGAHDVWSLRDPADPARGITGHGVTVAVVDTGVGDVEGLRGRDKVVHSPDLSADGSSPSGRRTAARRAGVVDGMGHGTHMAGLVAGRDEAVVSGHEADPRHFVGMAPDARVVSVEVGADDGRVGVPQVVAGVRWVLDHRDELDIRVLNLSYSATTADPAELASLSAAVQDAHDAGLVVVAAAGNDGADAGPDGRLALTMPAAHPAALAVGSTDHAGTTTTADDRVGDWSNPGTATRRPDLVAPGRSVAGLRLPGSQADREHPEGLVAGDTSGRFFRGTGTSQSAAVVSGAAALLLQADPTLSPDAVRALLTASAVPLAGDDDPAQGAGRLDVAGAVERALTGAARTGGRATPVVTDGAVVASPAQGAEICADWSGSSWSGRSWSGRSWSADDWSGRSWSGRSWSGRSWSGRSWSADDWSGRSWSADDWSGRGWSGRSWSGRSWSADDWSGRSWSGRSWSGRSWSGRSWSADDWSGRSWSGRSWSGRSWSADDWSGRSWSGRSWSADGWSGRSWS